MRRMCTYCKRCLVEVRDVNGDKVVPGAWCSYHGRETQGTDYCAAYVDLADNKETDRH